jgi:biofilm protein TabA
MSIRLRTERKDTMIVANLDQLAEQAALTPSMRQALAFLQQAQSQELADGRIAIDGERVYALVQSYDSRTGDVVFEGHRRCIDFQYVVRGEEALGWAPTERATVVRPYNEERDIWLGTVPAAEITLVHLAAGHLAVLYPSDAHAPGRAAAGASTPVKKIVVKVAV